MPCSVKHLRQEKAWGAAARGLQEADLVSAVCGWVWGTCMGHAPCFPVPGAGAAYKLFEK